MNSEDIKFKICLKSVGKTQGVLSFHIRAIGEDIEHQLVSHITEVRRRWEVALLSWQPKVFRVGDSEEKERLSIIEAASLVAALDDLGKDPHGVLGSEWIGIGGIGWSF